MASVKLSHSFNGNTNCFFIVAFFYLVFFLLFMMSMVLA